MVYDDLPSNLEYLDESFSASAGLRELDDGEFEDFNEDESMQVNISDQTGIISVYGGETVRLLDTQGLRIVENYFETLPPAAMDESKQCVTSVFFSLHAYKRAPSGTVKPL